MQKFRYHCLTKWIALPFSAPSSGDIWAKNKFIPRAFSVSIPFSTNSLYCWCNFTGYRRHLPNLVKLAFSWLWRICLRIWVNQKFSYRYFKWIILLQNIVLDKFSFSQLLVYPGKMLQLLLLWQLSRDMKIEHQAVASKEWLLREIRCILYTGLEL